MPTKPRPANAPPAPSAEHLALVKRGNQEIAAIYEQLLIGDHTDASILLARVEYLERFERVLSVGYWKKTRLLNQQEE